MTMRSLQGRRSPRRRLVLVLPLGLLALGLGGCSGDEDDDSSRTDDDTSAGTTPMTTSTPTATSSPDPATSTPVPTGTPADPTEPATATPGPSDGTYSALIRRTSHGVVHVLADDLGSAAYGQAYAFAQDHVCTLADQIVKVRSERSKFFGPGANDANLDSDFGFLALRVYADAKAGFPKQSDDARAMLSGFVAGYNQYLEETGPDGLPPECAGAAWVRPIDEIDLLAYYLSAALLSSGEALISGIVHAQPPSPSAAPQTLPPMPDLLHREIGSNGWALGGDRTATGRGMIAANPHFPWEGELKLFESQLTVPGVLNVYGASLLGFTPVNIGFNDDVAWTHTVTSASHLTMYSLSLVPGDPTRYRYDGGIKQMTSTTFTLDVLQPDGTYAQESRRLYRSHYGPIIAVEGAGWSTTQAFTYRDANENDQALLEQFLHMATASDLNAFKASFQQIDGIPWVHTMVADRDGNAFYIDASAVPNLSPQAIAGWQAALRIDPLTQYAWSLGLPLLDGSDSTNEWVNDPGARNGLIPYSAMPQLDRRDFVANANDNHWLTNPAVPLEGYSPLYLAERSPRSTRTRMNLVELTESGDTAAAGEDGKFSLEELQDTLLSNRGMLEELLLEQVVERCTGVTVVQYENRPVNIQAACEVLAGWDGREDLDSVGVAVWREFIGTFDAADLIDAGTLFKVGFDPANPVATPNTLADEPVVGTDPILENLAAAVSRLESAGVAIDAPLGDIQFTLKGSEHIPLHGGQGFEGVANVIVYSSGLNSTLLPRMPRGEVVYDRTDLTKDGYEVNYGSSFIMALEFTDDGPRARAFLTYSQSDYAASPWYADQTRLFSDKTWRDIAFDEEDIAADPELEAYEISNVE
jgi:acyl-homoserine-lactone acylase